MTHGAKRFPFDIASSFHFYKARIVKWRSRQLFKGGGQMKPTV